MQGRVPPLVRDAWAGRRTETLARQFALAGNLPVEALVFDAYGTLLDLGAVEAACARLTARHAEFAALWRAKQLEHTWLRTLMGRYADFERVTAEAFAYTLDRFDLAADAALRGAVLDSWLTLDPFPEAPAALARLRERPLAILSNGSPAMLEVALVYAELDGVFGQVLSVDAARAYKPDPRAYALAPAALDLPAERILFVSSNPWDAIGAKHHGYQVAWCNRADLVLDTHGPPPDLEVRDLAQVADALGQ